MDENEVVTEEAIVPEAPQTPQYTELEQRALDTGWKPKEEWEGPEDEWRPAKEYVERGEMIGKIRAANQRVEAVEKALRHVAEQNKKVYANGYDQAIRDLKNERRAALADGDLVKAEDLSEKIEEVKEQKNVAIQEAGKPVKQIANAPEPEHLEWLEQNPWYNHPVMMKFADGLAEAFIEANQGRVTPEQIRQYVAKTVREEFPHRFPKPEGKKVVAAPSPDEAGKGTSSAGKSTSLDSRLSKIKADMPDEHRQIMRTMMRSTGMTEREYLEQYAS